MLRVPKNNRGKNREREQRRDIGLPTPPPAPRFAIPQREAQGYGNEQTDGVFRKRADPQPETDTPPRGRAARHQCALEIVERCRPSGSQGRVGGHEQPRKKEEGQGLHQHHGGERGRLIKKVARQTIGKDRRNHTAAERARADSELRLAEGGRAHLDQPRNHRWVVEISDVEMARVIPVVRFLRQKLDGPEIHPPPSPRSPQIGWILVPASPSPATTSPARRPAGTAP